MVNKIKQIMIAGLVIVLSFLTGKVRIRPAAKKEEADAKKDTNLNDELS